MARSGMGLLRGIEVELDMNAWLLLTLPAGVVVFFFSLLFMSCMRTKRLVD
jgi:hypothetical protein